MCTSYLRQVYRRHVCYSCGTSASPTICLQTSLSVVVKCSSRLAPSSLDSRPMERLVCFGLLFYDWSLYMFVIHVSSLSRPWWGVTAQHSHLSKSCKKPNQFRCRSLLLSYIAWMCMVCGDYRFFCVISIKFYLAYFIVHDPQLYRINDSAILRSRRCSTCLQTCSK